jgi:hypothetical protein
MEEELKISDLCARESFADLFLIYGLNAQKFEDFTQKPTYEVLGSYPEPNLNKDSYIQSLNLICFPDC